MTKESEDEMGTKIKPGAYDCYANAAPDEPMFVLLARDRDAPGLVSEWADIREHRSEDPAKVQEARDCADAMRAWKKVHPTTPKDEATTALKSGDVVTLKSGGPLMTVERVGPAPMALADLECLCAWFATAAYAGGGSYATDPLNVSPRAIYGQDVQRGTFHVDMLRKVEAT